MNPPTLTTSPKTQLSRTALLYVSAAFISNAALLMAYVPWWITLVAAICLFWRAAIFIGLCSFPTLWHKLLIVAVCAVGLFFQFRYRVALDMFVSMLLLGFSLKLLEVYHNNSAQYLLYLAFFVLMTFLLFEQGMGACILALLQIYLLFSSLIAINSDPVFLMKRPLSALKISAGLLGFALPLMAALFLVMPRFSPLWTMPLKKQQASTGMSAEMAPGDITQFSRSSDLVLRATFDGVIPPPKELYWRALVLDKFDGRNWTIDCDCNDRWHETTQLKHEPIGKHKHLSYQVMLEPSGNKWLYVLAQTSINDPMILSNSEGLFRHKKDIYERLVYTGAVPRKSEKTLTVLPSAERLRDTQLPPKGNPRTRAWVAKLQKTTKSPTELIQKYLQFFHESFAYTTQPPALGKNSIDDFLFGTQRGFCEHFSSSFVFLMRAAGIPARVVIGYLGGEASFNKNYVTVRQYDAHAWAEVWLDDQGWVRVDPTASVAPERIEDGFENLFFNDYDPNAPVRLWAYRKYPLIKQLQQQIDQVNYFWARSVLSYEQDTRHNLLKRLGLSSAWVLAAWLIGFFITGFIIFLSFLFWRNRYSPRECLCTRRYRKLCKAYAQQGIRRTPEETPMQYAQRVSDAKLPQHEQFFQISKQYSDGCYVSTPSNKATRKLIYAMMHLYWHLLFLAKRK